ncbi:MAG: rRNA pseudouridine synthase [Chitinophagales bacterium]|nr:rRNA pseudouridine synthase [Chitinophagales bacterium]MDW8418366.1 pseudouridine synthase [Chitinophagales bacterium]
MHQKRKNKKAGTNRQHSSEGDYHRQRKNKYALSEVVTNKKRNSRKKSSVNPGGISGNGTTKDSVKEYTITSGGRKRQTDKHTIKGKKTSDDIFALPPEQNEEFRLNKYLAHAGVASRRAADELIRQGRVSVNGQVITEMGYKVKPGDQVCFDGKPLSLEKKYYVLLNKPKDCITTVSDEKGRKTVMDLVRPAFAQIRSHAKVRLYPVGRLDRNTTGVLLLTNDGELAQRLTHPSSNVKKIYHVLLNKKLRKEDFDKIAEGGVVLEDGIAEVDEIAYPNPANRAEVGIQIHTGKNRFVRRLFEALGYEVVKLDRVYFAGLTKKDLPRGRWRFLTEEEVRLLKYFNN